ncbi:hypothetical protein K7432_015848 [Basidiobolus ranarum]|uniref:FH2 domain-containing protein n=1 Tax=Basidiobolus ranarum TaxID=34480 RepID=A0ABR2WFK4_9FUNG
MRFSKEGVFMAIEEKFPSKPVVLKIKNEIVTEITEEIMVLDPKRIHNINIALSKCKKMSPVQIKEAILEMNEFVMTMDLLEQLRRFVPSDDEIKLLEPFITDGSKLSRAEQFFIEILSIERYHQRLDIMYFKQTYKEKYDGIQQACKTIYEASSSLRHSKTIPKILEIILTVGNFMNIGFRGNASGFKVSSVNRLADTKTIDNKSTLLHFLIGITESKLPDLLKVVDELKLVSEACRVSMPDVKEDFDSMRKDLIFADQEMHEYFNESKYEHDSFAVQVKEFLVTANQSFEDLKVYWEATEVMYADCVRHFGENPTLRPDEFFQIFKHFLSDTERVRKEIELTERKRVAAEKKAIADLEKKEREVIRRKPRLDKTQNPDIKEAVEEDKGGLDHLMDSLRKCKDFGKTKQDGQRMTAAERLRNDQVRNNLGNLSEQARQLLNDINQDIGDMGFVAIEA